MSSECNIDLEKWEVADNMDLFYMVQDFEEYFEETLDLTDDFLEVFFDEFLEADLDFENFEEPDLADPK